MEAQIPQGRVLANYKASWTVNEVVFSPDGTRLAVRLLASAEDVGSRSDEHRLEVRDVKTGQLLTQCDVPGQLARSISSLVWSPDGKRLISTLKSQEVGSGKDENFRLVAWDSQSGRIVQSTPFPELPPLPLPSAIAVGGEGVGSEGKDGHWLAPPPQPENPRTLTILPDGRLASRGRSVALFDSGTLGLQGRFVVGGGEAALDFDPQRKLFATVKNGQHRSTLFANSQVQLWGSDTLQPVRALPLEFVRGASWSRVSGELAVWQGVAGRPPFNHPGTLSLWSAEGTHMNWKAPFDDTYLFDWSPTQPRHALYRAEFTIPPRGPFRCSGPRSTLMLRASSLEWWNSETRTSLWTQPFVGLLEMMQISPDGRLVYGLENRLYSTLLQEPGYSIWVWDTQTGQVRLHRKLKQNIRLQWAPQGARLALCGTGEGTLETLDF